MNNGGANTCNFARAFNTVPHIKLCVINFHPLMVYMVSC